jgi:GNAT superfamily N-acetyltransferase
VTTVDLRPPKPEELDAIALLCRRSKAHWGYDDAFLDACGAALRVSPRALASGSVVLAVGADAGGDELLGVVQVDERDGTAELGLLFVEPARMGQGVGRRLLRWAAERALRRGFTALEIFSDPGARAFYERMGAVYLRHAPSDAIPGRTLPLLRLDVTRFDSRR